MKIGLVCPYNMARGGAVQEIVRDMRVGLMARGHTVKIITGRPKDISQMDTIDMLFVGQVADFRSPTHTLASFTSGANADEDAQSIADEQFDILHFHEPGMPLLGRQLLGMTNCVNVATFHAKLPDTFVSRTVARAATPYLRTVLGDIQELTVGSEAAAEYLRELTDRPLEYIPNGVDLDVYRPVKRRVPGAMKTLLYIGRLEHRKGVNYLLQAYQLLAQDRDDIRLIIAGDGPDRDKLEKQAAELSLPNVSFLGYIDQQTKLQLLAEADLFCAPAIFGESFGLVLLEAMATGLVTVAGNNPGYAAVMQGMGQLSLVNPRDSEDFARRLQLLLEQEELRAEWRKWALKYVKQYSYKQIIRSYERQYKRAMKNHASKLAEAAN